MVLKIGIATAMVSHTMRLIPKIKTRPVSTDGLESWSIDTSSRRTSAGVLITIGSLKPLDRDAKDEGKAVHYLERTLTTLSPLVTSTMQSQICMKGSEFRQPKRLANAVQIEVASGNRIKYLAFQSYGLTKLITGYKKKYI